jgi:dynein heavy chain
LREPSKGIINIDGKKIKSKLLSHVTDRLNFMKDYMYNMMKDKSQILEDKITLYNEGFSKKPTDLS